MSRRKTVAPTLQHLLREPVKGVPMLAAYHGRSAVAELRALLAVARAAKRGLDKPFGFGLVPLERALARLARVSEGRAVEGNRKPSANSRRGTR